MDRTNPVYIPRNHLVEEALAAATAGDLEPLERLLDAVTRPVRRPARPRALRRARARRLRHLPDVLRDLRTTLTSAHDSDSITRRTPRRSAKLRNSIEISQRLLEPPRISSRSSCHARATRDGCARRGG